MQAWYALHADKDAAAGWLSDTDKRPGGGFSMILTSFPDSRHSVVHDVDAHQFDACLYLQERLRTAQHEKAAPCKVRIDFVLPKGRVCGSWRFNDLEKATIFEGGRRARSAEHQP